jgi:hypothetical protein
MGRIGMSWWAPPFAWGEGLLPGVRAAFPFPGRCEAMMFVGFVGFPRPSCLVKSAWWCCHAGMIRWVT